MKLKNILNLLNIQNIIDPILLNVSITNITTNSKKVIPGTVFIAIKGKEVDGHSFIKEAFENGAVMAFLEKNSGHEVSKFNNTDLYNKMILVKNTKTILDKICSIFYNQLPQNIIAVTGTNGKTSISCMFSQILTYLNINSAQLGTLGGFFNNKKANISTSLTTPTTEELFKFFNEAKLQHINNVIIEASSHGIHQGRLNNIPITMAAFSNLSVDHLDYHKDMENYFHAKSKLFLNLLKNHGLATINADDKYGKRLIELCINHNIKVLSYGKNGKFLKLTNIKLNNFGYSVTFSYNSKSYTVKLNILGRFQIYNLLCAVAIILSLNLTSIENILQVVPKIVPINGRLEYIKTYNEANIILDYAHTPEALELSLKAVREITFGKLYVLFGCGGNRDISKRKMMGEIASKLADFTYITDDNPRNENPENIRLEISKGFKNTELYKIIGNRKNAIIEAIKKLKPTDTLVVAGKGHEETQIIGKKIFSHSDKDIILNFK